MRRAIGFGRENETEEPEFSHESYRNSWVIIGDGDISAGIVKDIHSGFAYLMPYYAIKPIGGLDVHKVVREGLPYRVPLNERTKIRPTTEEETIEQCSIRNKREQRRLLLEELDFMAKTKNIHQEETFSDGSGI